MNNSNPGFPGREHILKARRSISPYIHQTPVFSNTFIDTLTGAKIFFKCENFQKVGAFKFRGASNAVFGMDAAACQHGVATHSSGNHAQALALAARLRNIAAYIVMPENAPRVKVDAVRSYGGIITFCEPTLQARESTLKSVVEQTGAVEVHPYNDYRVIAGQASAAAELIETAGPLDCIVAPVGGGGLLSGTILSARYFSDRSLVFGAEPLMANDAWQSFQARQFIPSENPMTIADGLKTSLGSLTFPIIMDGAENILTATEESIVNAMMLIWERMKIIVEPSAAVSLAAILEHPGHFSGKRTGVILSGGNVDLRRLPWQVFTLTQ